MRLNQFFELSMVLDQETFFCYLERLQQKSKRSEEGDGEYVDHSTEQNGIRVIYHNKQYRKKIKIIVCPEAMTGDAEPEPKELVRKLSKEIDRYFDHHFCLDDFILSSTIIISDFDMGSRKTVQEYLNVLRRIGRVKGFSPSEYQLPEKKDSFCLEGNSNGINFRIYNLESALECQYEKNMTQKQIRKAVRGAEGILRAEVRLEKPKAVQIYADTENTSVQIVKLSTHRKDVFIDVFKKIVPFGDFYKKAEAEEIIRKQVKDSRLKRKMLRLFSLIPEKKSLYLAQKTMEYRNMDKVMDAFAEIKLSPVTISKRDSFRKLENMYLYIC